MTAPRAAPSSWAIATGSLLLWLLVQLAALLLAALRVPLAAAYPQPAEFQAVCVLLAAQFAWAAILFPVLLCNWRMAAMTAACAWVMLVLASALAAWPIPDVIPAAGYLTLWIVVLGTWRAALPSPRWRMIASAIAATYVVGGALLWYLQLDLATGSPGAPSIVFAPMCIAVFAPRHLQATGWWLLAGLEIAGAAVAAAVHYRKSPAKT